MSTDLEAFRQQVEAQQDQILDYLARLGIATEAELDVPLPDPASPLAPIQLATRVVKENLALVAQERDATMRQLEEKLHTIELQTQAILELSTPVIQVWDDILVLPLVGTIDTARAQQIMESLLESVVQRRAAVVILDVTGVPVVDTKVANHLIKTIDAARLLGAEALLTGVSPTNAQTLVRLGVDLTSITTRSSLQAGLRRAFELTRQRVVKEKP
jgi:rsbT co-antagonist protein RsbR